MKPTRQQLDKAWLILLVVGAIYATVMVGVAAYRARAPYTEGVGTSDFVAFWVTSRHFLDTGRITTEAGTRNYLPFYVLLFVPLALLPCWLGAAVWTMLSIGCLVLSVTMILRALLGENRAPPIIAVGVPVMMTVPFINSCLVLGQVSILMLMLCVLTWWLVAMRKPLPAGISLSIAILVKPFLASLLVFLVLKRQWRAAASTLVWIGLFGAGLTLVSMEPREWIDAHRGYYQRVVKGQTPLVAIASDRPRYARFSNQSLSIVLRRLMTDTQAGRRREPFQVNFASCTTRAPQVAYVAVMLALAAVTVVVGRHPPRRIEPRRAHFEFAMFMLLGLFGSPIVWTHYFPLVIYALILLTVERQRDRESGRANRLAAMVWWFWIAAACSLITEAFMLAYLRAVGIHMIATLLVWLAMGVCAVRIPPIDGDGEMETDS